MGMKAASMCARYASPQTEDVVTTGEGRMGLLGDWREVSPPPQCAVLFVLMATLSLALPCLTGN